MSEPRKTPRTDAEEQWAEWNDNEFKCVPVARELERELAAAQEAALHAQEHCLTAQARGFDLQAQLDAARNALSEAMEMQRDAARWRWWRRWWCDGKDDMETINDLKYDCDDPSSYDAAVDAAIAAEGAPK